MEVPEAISVFIKILLATMIEILGRAKIGELHNICRGSFFSKGIFSRGSLSVQTYLSRLVEPNSALAFTSTVLRKRDRFLLK